MRDPLEESRELFEGGLVAIQKGDLQEAVKLLDRSLDVLPSAEAYTYRGWAYSFEERYDDAIADCQRAIATDPEFGNPYNDIGCYLLSQGDADGAIPWFERAKEAPRYEPRHFPYINLGRILLARGEVERATAEFRKALEIEPRDPVAAKFLRYLEQSSS